MAKQLCDLKTFQFTTPGRKCPWLAHGAAASATGQRRCTEAFSIPFAGPFAALNDAGVYDFRMVVKEAKLPRASNKLIYIYIRRRTAHCCCGTVWLRKI